MLDYYSMQELVEELVERFVTYVTLSSRLEDRAKDVYRVAHDLRAMKGQLERMVWLSTEFLVRQPSEEVKLWLSRADKPAVTSSELIQKAGALLYSSDPGGLCSMAWFATIRLVRQLEGCLPLLQRLVSDGERLISLQAVADGLPELESCLRHAGTEGEGDGLGTLMHQVLLQLEQKGVHMIGLPIELKTFAQKAEYIKTMLDNLEGAIDLNQNLTSKRVFTTRLEPQPQTSFQPLTEAQAWKLFVNHVGAEVMYTNPAIFPFAKTLVQKCRGQRHVLTIVGLSMLGKTHPEEWADAVKAFDDDRSDLLSPIFKSCYDNLPHQTAKSCFLYCALYPEGLPILKSELLELWTSQKDWDIVDETGDQRSNARSVLRSLVQARLLDDHGEWVTMPEMIRSMALEIAKPDVLVMAGRKLNKEPDVAGWEGKKMVSLMHNNLRELMEVPTCPTLFTLLLNKNEQLLKVCDRFFESMGKLTVLNLSYTGIMELPSNLSSLLSLEHLDISYTKIKKLPIVLKELVNLKHFDVNGLDLSLNRLDRLISYLASLQVLKMLCDYQYDQEDGEITMHDDEILMEELQHLERMTVLQITVSSVSSLEKLIATPRLSRRTQTLCFRRCKDPSVDVSLLESMENIESLFVTQSHFKELHVSSYRMRCLSSITRVAVNDCVYLEHLTCLVLMPNLRILEVLNCRSLQEILNEDRLQGIMAQHRYLKPFSNLAVLELFNLSTLVKICSTSLPLPFLHELRVSECPHLKKLPLNLDSSKGCSIQLTADEDWFDKEIEWEDDETRYAVRSRFKFSTVITRDERKHDGPKPPKMNWPRQR